MRWKHVRTGGGLFLIAALAEVLSERSRETKRDANLEHQRRSALPWFGDGISQDEFVIMATETARTLPRFHDVDVDGMAVMIAIRSITGLTTWGATVDFGDHGRLTGRFWLESENEDSPIPRHYANLMSVQIKNRLQAQPPSAGWYADPWCVARLRYWNGTHWTGYLHP